MDSLDPIVNIDIESSCLAVDVPQYHLTVCVVDDVVECCVHLCDNHLGNLDSKCSRAELGSRD